MTKRPTRRSIRRARHLLRPTEQIQRRHILDEYARRGEDGRPVFCTPAYAEVKGRTPRREPRGTDGKPIYDTEQKATLAAEALQRIDGLEHRPYQCNRSSSGHYHLTTSKGSDRR